jgi:hypothetical protein
MSDNLITIVPIVLKSGSLNLLEPSKPEQACTGIDLPFSSRLHAHQAVLSYLFLVVLTL